MLLVMVGREREERDAAGDGKGRERQERDAGGDDRRGMLLVMVKGREMKRRDAGAWW